MNSDWIRRDNSCHYEQEHDAQACEQLAKLHKWEQMEELDCCPPHYICQKIPSRRGICVPVGSKWTDWKTEEPIGSPDLFTSTRSKKTILQEREAIQDPYVSEFDSDKSQYTWRPVSVEDLRRIHQDILRFMQITKTQL